MIGVDSSALLAILFREAEKQAFENLCRQCRALHHIGGERARDGYGAAHSPRSCRRGTLWRLLAENEIEIIAFDEMQVQAAAVAFDRYGKGLQSKAQLNLSDCAAYALAKSMNAPLLFKGNDFAETDIESAI